MNKEKSMKNNMKRIRIFFDITQDELAMKAGYSQALISKLERDVILPAPSVEKMKMKVSEALGYPKNKVFPGEEEAE